MLICVKDKCGLVVEKNGVLLHFGSGTCYSADIMKCPACGHQMAFTGKDSFFRNEDALAYFKANHSSHFMDMQKPLAEPETAPAAVAKEMIHDNVYG